MPDTRPPATRFSRRTTPCWSKPAPFTKVAHTVRSGRLGPAALQKNSRLLLAPDRGAVTTTVPGRGLEYVYWAQSGVTRLMHVVAPDCAEAVSIFVPPAQAATVHATAATAASADSRCRCRRRVAGRSGQEGAATAQDRWARDD